MEFYLPVFLKGHIPGVWTKADEEPPRRMEEQAKGEMGCVDGKEDRQDGAFNLNKILKLSYCLYL